MSTLLLRRSRITGPLPTSTVVVLFPTRERLLDAAWRLLTAVDDLKRRGELDEARPLVVCMSRYEQLRPELFLSPAAYELAARLTIRMRDTEAAAAATVPAQCFALIDTRRFPAVPARDSLLAGEGE